MKISIINGSPKGGKSTSELMIGYLTAEMSDYDVKIYNICKTILSEEQTFQRKDIMVYSIVNNGFYEGKQNRIVIEQMKHWCKAVGLKWG